MNIDPCEIRSIVRMETLRTGAPLHDEDLEQDAALKAFEAFRRQFKVRHPRAFLRKVVVDAVRDHWRKRRPPEDWSAVDESRLAVPPQFEERMDLQRRVDLLRRAMAELDAAKKDMLDLYYMEEWSVGDIARAQKLSVSAVKMQLLRARRMLAGIVREMAEGKR